MIRLLGWTNATIILLMSTIYPLKQIYLKGRKRLSKKRADILGNTYRTVRKLHPKLGITVVSIGLYHGYNAFGLTELHTGTVLLYTVMSMGALAFIGPRVKWMKTRWRTLHRVGGLVVLGLVMTHIFNRDLIQSLSLL